ncbi:MAG TPA: hypothetical protein VGL56_08620 [Fimbriimonadaceae bacterium]
MKTLTWNRGGIWNKTVMRRFVVCGLLLLVGFIQCAFATDYELTVDTSAKNLTSHGTVTIYEPFGLIKPGDHVVKILAGPIPKPAMSCRVLFSAGQGSTILASKGSIRSFPGEIRLGQGTPGGSTLQAALLMHVGPSAGEAEKAGLLKDSWDYISGHPLVWIGLGLLGLLIIGIMLLRMGNQPAGVPPTYGKKAYEENVREVKTKLERIMEAQEYLVKKPPVLRSFSKQIDRFDKRLDKLEVTSVSSQQALSVIASSVVELQKSLEQLITHHEESQSSVDSLKAGLANQAEEQKRAAAALRQDLKEQTSQTAELTKGLNDKIAGYAQKLDTIGAGLREELTVLKNKVIESEGVGKELAAAAIATEKANIQRSEEIAKRVAGLATSLEGLSPLPANVSELHGKAANLKAEMASLGQKITESTNEFADFKRTSVLAYAGTEDKISELRTALGEISTELSKISPELETARMASEGNAGDFADLKKRLDTLSDSAATRKQLASLEAIPDAIALLKSNLEGVDARLSSVGLSKEDQHKILQAHEKLSTLPGEVSQTLQRVLEQKLTGLLAQSMTAKKGKDSEGSGVSDRGAAALSEVANHLIAEIEQQKNLENVLADVKKRLDLLPDALQKIETQISLSATNNAAPQPIAFPMEEIRTLFEKTEEVVRTVPDRFDALEKRFESNAEQLRDTSERLGETIHLVKSLELKASQDPAPSPVPVVQITTPQPVKEEPVEAIKAEPARAEEPVAKELVEAISNVAEQEAALAVVPTAAAEELLLPVEPEVTKSPELILESESLRPAPKAKRTAVPLDACEWVSSGANLRGTWSTSTSGSIELVQDTEKAMRPLTPTETPGIEYEIGAMLFAQDKIVYAHGDSIRAFWPGQNERSILLSHMVPTDPWRLLLLGQRLFCVQEKRVEILDLGTWSRSSFFVGEYLNQCGLGSIWAGVKSGSTTFLELRDFYGEPVGSPYDLGKDFKESLPMVSDGEYLYLANLSGEVIRANRSGSDKFANVGDGKTSKVTHFILSSRGPVGIVAKQNSVTIKLLSQDGTVAQSAVYETTQISGNVVEIAGQLHFYDADKSTVVSCDLESMKVEEGAKLQNVDRMRRMVGFSTENKEMLLIAGSDAGGKLGTVFLLDPESHQQVFLCSTNQPHVDAIFAGGRPVVATSSSYQNIIRVFQPFVSSDESSQAA